MTGCLLVAGDFAHHGGMDRANLELARFLSIDRPVHLVAHHVANDVAQLPNVTVHHVPRPFGKHLLGQPLLARAGRSWAHRLTREGFRVVVNGGNCSWADVNWVHYVHYASIAPVSGQGLRWAKTRLVEQLNRWTELRAIRAARVVICNSRRTARDAIEGLGADPTRVRVIYLGTDPNQFHPPSAAERAELRTRLGWSIDRPVVMFVGALGDRRKGFDSLFAAWQLLCREKSWDAVLVVVGRGAELPAWEARARSASLAHSTRFLGFRSDVPDLLRAADALVHPARYEAYGLGVHEALCCGIPALVSSAAGVSERYPPDLADLLLTDSENPDELADRLRYWRAHQESLGARVRPLADELRSYTWADMAHDLVAAIEGMPVVERLPRRPDAAPENSRRGPVDVSG